MPKLHPFTERLDDLLKAENLNKRKLALALGYDNAEKIYRLWREENARPGYDILEDIARRFENYSLEWLLTGKGEMLRKTAYTPGDKSLPSSVTRSNRHIPGTAKGSNVHPTVHPTVHPKGKSIDFTPQIITVDSSGNENILYVPIKARAGYLSGYGDPEYVSSLQSFNVPGLRTGTYRMFEVEGPSMAPTIGDKDAVICEYVASFDDIRDGRVYVVVTKSRGIVVKRLLNRISERGKLVCKSDTIAHRKEYPTFQLDPEDIREMWYGRIIFSADFSEPAEIYHRLNDLEADMVEMKQFQGLLMQNMSLAEPAINPTKGKGKKKAPGMEA